ncbi:MAG: hypothetical protein ACE145_21505 [Terriglobia bacterium]
MNADTLRYGAYVIGVVVANVIASSVSWRILGTKSQNLRRVGRVLGAAFCVANLGLVAVSVLHILWHGGDWFYVALLLVGLVFAFRIGGAAVGRYP